MSLVVVSNRIAKVRANEPIAGGLASALLPVVRTSGAIWVGSSGRVRDASHKDSFAEIEAFGAGAIATVDLPAASYRGYYEGFSNSVLWPALHSRPDLIRATQDDYRCYRDINAFMARGLLRFCRADSTDLIHDYHFLTLRGLRHLGARACAAFAPGPDPRDSGRLPLLSRYQRIHGARPAAVLPRRLHLLDPRLPLPHARRRAAAPAGHASARLLPPHALADPLHDAERAASSRAGRGDARLRSDRLPDR